MRRTPPFRHLLRKPMPAEGPSGVYGGFGTGVVPPGMTNGSTGTVLKLYGDINGDGDMVYSVRIHLRPG